MGGLVRICDSGIGLLENIFQKGNDAIAGRDVQVEGEVVVTLPELQALLRGEEIVKERTGLVVVVAAEVSPELAGKAGHAAIVFFEETAVGEKLSKDLLITGVLQEEFLNPGKVCLVLCLEAAANLAGCTGRCNNAHAHVV